jgi:hypothetical protein
MNPQARGGSLPRPREGGSIGDASPLGTDCKHYFAKKSVYEGSCCHLHWFGDDQDKPLINLVEAPWKDLNKAKVKPLNPDLC